MTCFQFRFRPSIVVPSGGETLLCRDILRSPTPLPPLAVNVCLPLMLFTTKQAQLQDLQPWQQAHRQPRAQNCRACLRPTASRWSQHICQSGEFGHQPSFRGRGCLTPPYHFLTWSGRRYSTRYPLCPGGYIVCILPVCFCSGSCRVHIFGFLRLEGGCRIQP